MIDYCRENIPGQMLFPVKWLQSCSGIEQSIANGHETFDMIVVGNDEQPFHEMSG